MIKILKKLLKKNDLDSFAVQRIHKFTLISESKAENTKKCKVWGWRPIFRFSFSGLQHFEVMTKLTHYEHALLNRTEFVVLRGHLYWRVSPPNDMDTLIKSTDGPRYVWKQLQLSRLGKELLSYIDNAGSMKLKSIFEDAKAEE